MSLEGPALGSWCEISSSALRHNVAQLRALLRAGAKLGVVV
jgi:hypothetical protein